MPDVAPDQARPRDRPREPPPLRADDGAREPRDGVVPPAEGGSEGGVRARLHALPAALRAPVAARRDAVGRRAADGRDGSCAHVAAPSAAHGRAVDGPRAGARRAELRDHPAGARVGGRHAHRRAERERLAVDRRSRLRAVDRPDRARGEGVGADRRTRISARRTSGASAQGREDAFAEQADRLARIRAERPAEADVRHAQFAESAAMRSHDLLGSSGEREREHRRRDAPRLPRRAVRRRRAYEAARARLA